MENGQKSILTRTFNFSVEIVKLVKRTPFSQTSFPLLRQLIRSSTSVGANIEEAQDSHSKKEFVQKTSIALKEARETYYWLRLLQTTDIINDASSITQESLELVKILTTIVKNSKSKN